MVAVGVKFQIVKSLDRFRAFFLFRLGYSLHDEL